MNVDSLPEDLAPVNNPRLLDHPTELRVSLSVDRLALNGAAHAAIGHPERVEILWGAQSRVLAFRPVERGGRKFSPVAGQAAQQIGGVPLGHLTGLSWLRRGQPLRLVGRIVDGCLLVGPLPEVGA